MFCQKSIQWVREKENQRQWEIIDFIDQTDRVDGRMTITRTLITASYPAVLIEQWVGRDGWPCWRVSLALPGHIVPIGADHPTLAAAHAEAIKVAASLSQRCTLVDLTKELGA